MKKEAGKIRFETFKKQDEQESPIDSENSKSPEAAFNISDLYEWQAAHSFVHTVETMASRRLRNANDPSQDHQFKNVVMDLAIFALILKKVYPDFRPYSIQEICEFIQPGYASDSPEDRKKFLENSEQVFGQSGRLHYDILSWIRHMKTGEDILINIEMQRTNLSADQLLGRIILYLSQMVQFQKNNDKGFLKDHYEQIKPMRTLWIFPRTRKNKITSAKFKLALANEPDELDRKLAEQLERLFDIQLIFINPEDLATIDKNEALNALYMLFCWGNREATLQYVQKEGIVVERSIEEFVDKYHYSLMAFDETERKELCLCMEEVIRQANETFREKEELEKSYKELEKVNNKLQKRIRELEMSQQK